MTRMATYHPVGKCIYCGATDELTDEHIVPYALGGASILPASSCRPCAAETSAFEGRCASTMYGDFRLRADLPTRRRKNRPTHVKVSFTDPDGAREIELPKDAVGGVMPVIELLPAGYLRSPRIREPGIVGMTLGYRAHGARRPDLAPRGQYGFEQKFDVGSYLRLLAKVGHATAVGMLGIDAFDHWLVPCILGFDPAWTYLIGGSGKDAGKSDHLHDTQVQLWPYEGTLLVLVNIRLFAEQGGQWAWVVAGETSPRRQANAKPFLIDLGEL